MGLTESSSSKVGMLVLFGLSCLTVVGGLIIWIGVSIVANDLGVRI